MFEPDYNKIYENFDRMMVDRGYTRLGGAFSRPLVDGKFDPKVLIEYRNDTKSDPVLCWFITDVKVDKKFLENIPLICIHYNIKNFIIVLLNRESISDKKIFEIHEYCKIFNLIQDGLFINCEIFNYDFFVINMDRYSSNNQTFRIATEQEKEGLLKAYGKQANFHQMAQNDRIARWFGAKPGDIIIEEFPSINLPYYIENGKRINNYDINIYSISDMVR